MVKRLINRIPFKVSMSLCIVLFLFAGIMLSSITINLLDKFLCYIDGGKSTIVYRKQGDIELVGYRNGSWLKTANAIEGIVIPLIFCSITTLAGAGVFYRWKMKKPISQLFNGIKKIEERDLDFKIAYSAPDELGKLCEGFEMMRNELDKNFKEMWRSQEERKLVNSAFAHDLRTPLTVMKGQIDVLRKQLECGRMEPQKALASLSYVQQSIERCERYVNEMTLLQKLEEISLSKKEISMQEYAEGIRNVFIALPQDGKVLEVVAGISDSILHIDVEHVTRVIENLVSNALRYAKQYISIKLDADRDVFIVRVSDDGRGFGDEALCRGLEPFYREDRSDKNFHLGLGLNICKILAEKHGGSVALSNNSQGGACVTAKFSMEK